MEVTVDLAVRSKWVEPLKQLRGCGILTQEQLNEAPGIAGRQLPTANMQALNSYAHLLYKYTGWRPWLRVSVPKITTYGT